MNTNIDEGIAIITNIFESQKESNLSQGDAEIRITIEDAKQIRTALLDVLRQSELGDRDVLIELTEPLPAWIDSDGRVMVGGWLLQIRNGELVATYRLSENVERAIGYAASVVKDGKDWRVTRIVPEKIRFRR